MQQFETWKKWHTITVPLCEASFFAELMKKDGTDYEPEALQTMLATLDRFLSGTKWEKQLNSENMAKENKRTEQTR